MIHSRPTGEGQLMPRDIWGVFTCKGMFGKGENVYPQHPQA
jgi:hypothetical protein